MITRRRSFTLASAAIVIFSAALFAQTTPQPRKLTDAEKKEIQTVQKVVDDAAAGQSAPNEVGLTWVHEDLLKAQGNKQYLPFSVSIDPSKISGNKLTFYWRVVSTEAPAAAANAKDAKKDEGKAPPNKDVHLLAIVSDNGEIVLDRGIGVEELVSLT